MDYQLVVHWDFLWVETMAVRREMRKVESTGTQWADDWVSSMAPRKVAYWGSHLAVHLELSKVEQMANLKVVRLVGH